VKRELATDELDTAEARLNEIHAQRAQLLERQAGLELRIGSAQQEIARRYLHGDRAGIKETAELRAEIDAIQSALVLLSEDAKAAKLNVERARAQRLRRQASEKRAELEALNAQTAALLAKLGELESVPYTHSILSSQPYPGSWLRPATLQQPLEYEGIVELQLNIPAEQKLYVPRSRKLRMEITELELQAEKIEQAR
jgi:multidrug efflux pump subunit AcrA (membrane-fusion protein)